MPRQPKDPDWNPEFDGEDEEYGGQAPQLTPQQMEQMKEERREVVREYIAKRFGYEEDEIATMFPDDAALEAFMQDVRKISDAKDESYLEEAGEENEEDNTLVLSPRDAQRLKPKKKTPTAASQSGNKSAKKSKKAVEMPPEAEHDQLPQGEAEPDDFDDFLDTLKNLSDEDIRRLGK